MQKSLTVLVVEDDPYFLSSIALELARYGEVIQAKTLDEAKEALRRQKFHVAFIDLHLSEGSGPEGLELVELAYSKAIIPIVLTGAEDKRFIADAYEKGCRHYFGKFDFQENVHERVGRFLRSLGEDDFIKRFKQDFITQDAKLVSKMQYLMQQNLDYEQKILLLGPSGVGKTKLASWIHRLAGGTEENFVAINLAEIPENLLESELFGHVKGAFTGAINTKESLLSRADGGTLFLDEIGAIPIQLQKKLLKVIEERKYSPVGSNEVRSSRFRLITATCDDLGELIDKGDFRVDFYFRIKGIEVHIPALKDRVEDIPLLIEYFLNKSPRKIIFAEECMRILKRYSWFGNVRELESFVREYSHSIQGVIRAEELPTYMLLNQNPYRKHEDSHRKFLSQKMLDFLQDEGLPKLVNEIEKEALEFIMQESEGKVNEAQRRLRISKSLLYRIMSDLKVDKGVSFARR